MNATTRSSRRYWSIAALVGVFLLFGAPMPTRASAGTPTLQLVPEWLGGTEQVVEITARLDAPTVVPRVVSFEVESMRVPLTADGFTPDSPDGRCVVAPTATECVATIQSVPDGTRIYGWIDIDADPSTVELDRTEGQYSGPGDCTPEEDAAPCGSTPAPGAVAEPDGTDVIRRLFVEPPPAPVYNLDVTPEVIEHDGVSPMIFTATLSQPAAVDLNGVPVSFEWESGPFHQRGSYSMPDARCGVMPGTTSCSIVLDPISVAQAGGQSGGVWRLRAYVDVPTPGGVRIDFTEGRQASPTDCHPEGTENECDFPVQPGDTPEPDLTDLVQVGVSDLPPPGNAPPMPSDDTASTPKRTAVVVDVLANDADPDGDALVVTAVSSPAHGVAVIEGDGVRYTPERSFRGTDTFRYTVDDGHGHTATATVTVHVGET